MGPSAGLDGCGISHPHQDSIPGPSSTYPFAIPTELSQPTDMYSTLYKLRVYRPSESITLIHVFVDDLSTAISIACARVYNLCVYTQE